MDGDVEDQEQPIDDDDERLNEHDCPPWQPIGSNGTWSTQRRHTAPSLTKYEQTVVLQRRARQLGLNAPPYVPVGPHDEPNPISIAQRELYEGKLDMVVERHMPDGRIEYWNVNELLQPIFT